MAKLEQIITLTKEQYETLLAGETLTINNVDYTYNQNALYMVPDEPVEVDINESNNENLYLMGITSENTNDLKYTTSYTVNDTNLSPSEDGVSSLGTNSKYWHGIYADGDGAGVLDWNNLKYSFKKSYDSVDTSRGLARILGATEAVGTFSGGGSKIWGMPPEAITLEYTTNALDDEPTWVEIVGQTQATTSSEIAQKRSITNCSPAPSICVGNLVYDYGSGNTAPVTAGMGCRITLDTQIENRMGYLDCFSAKFESRGHICAYKLEYYNKNTDIWTTIYTKENYNNIAQNMIYFDKQLYMNGNSSTNNSSYLNKLRLSFWVTALGTFNQQAPCVYQLCAWGEGNVSIYVNSTYPYSRNFDYYMARSNFPMYFNDRNAPIIKLLGQCYDFSGNEGYYAANTNNYAMVRIGNANKKSVANNHAEGQLYIYSAENGAHMVRGTSITSNITHTLPSTAGWVATGGNGSSTGAGSNSLPVYLDTAGILQPITINSTTRNNLESPHVIKITATTSSDLITTLTSCYDSIGEPFIFHCSGATPCELLTNNKLSLSYFYGIGQYRDSNMYRFVGFNDDKIYTWTITISSNTLSFGNFIEFSGTVI